MQRTDNNTSYKKNERQFMSQKITHKVETVSQLKQLKQVLGYLQQLTFHLDLFLLQCADELIEEAETEQGEKNKK